MSLALTAIGLWWALLFSQDSLAYKFGNVAIGAEQRDTPISISIIAYLLILQNVWVIWFIFQKSPAFFVGHTIKGLPGTYLHSLTMVVAISLGVGLLRGKRFVYSLAICYLIYESLNATIFYQSAQTLGRFSIAVRRASLNGSKTSLTAFLVIVGVLPSVIQIYFLMTRKAAFYKNAEIDPLAGT